MLSRVHRSVRRWHICLRGNPGPPRLAWKQKALEFVVHLLARLLAGFVTEAALNLEPRARATCPKAKGLRVQLVLQAAALAKKSCCSSRCSCDALRWAQDCARRLNLFGCLARMRLSRESNRSSWPPSLPAAALLFQPRSRLFLTPMRRRVVPAALLCQRRAKSTLVASSDGRQ